MKLLPEVFIVILGIVSFKLDFVQSEGKEKSCKAIVADITKRQLNGIAGCSKSLKFKNGKEKSKKMNCILKCVMTKEKLLTDEGILTKEQVDILLEKEFPPSMIERASKVFIPCAELAYGKLDPSNETDEFCKSYDPLIRCFLAALPNLCA